MAAPTIHVHTSAPDAFFVNSFVIEGDRSLVLVDTQFVLSEAQAVARRIDALGKPLAAIVITHPHPDHYNGLATILARHPGTPVHATAATIAGIRETAEPKRAYWTPIVGTNYPQEFAYPDTVIADGQTITVDGITLEFADLGPAECSDNTMILLPQIDTAIVSDIVYSRVHPWLAEGRSLRWLRAIEVARGRLAGVATLYPGHGTVGSAAILAEQASYITMVRERVAAALDAEGALTDAARTALADAILAQHPDWPLGMIIAMNLDGIAAELAAR
jgi:glyoxylase-like metal-dependent hydrolase (beta-lactamase superfamily II)